MQKNLLTILATLIVTFGAGVYVGYEHIPAERFVTNVANKNNEEIESVDFSVFWETWKILEDRYVPASSTKSLVTNQEKVWSATEGLARAYGDPYTIFLPPEENEVFSESINGEFSGVGMEVGMENGIISVIAPLKNTPAEKAGIKAGDLIIEIDGQSTADLNIDDAVKLIRGETGTEVVLTVFRKSSSETLDIPIVRDVIDIPSVRTELIEKDGEEIFVIELISFSALSARDFRDSLQEFIDTNTDKLVLDLRGNPGGFLEAAVDIASWFLPEGATVVREFDGEDEIVHRSRGYNIFTDQLKMVVLVDKGSASASEILAGALSENGIATLVGEETFGKGSVQELIKVKDGTSIKVTIARWLTPEGKSISDSGLTPDVPVEYSIEDFDAGIDPQKDRAIDILLSE